MYLVYQYKQIGTDVVQAKEDSNAKQKIASGEISLGAYLNIDFKDFANKGNNDLKQMQIMKPTKSKTVIDSKEPLVNMKIMSKTQDISKIKSKSASIFKEKYKNNRYSVHPNPEDGEDINKLRKRVRKLVKPFFDR